MKHEWSCAWRVAKGTSNDTIDDICRARVIRKDFKSGFSDNVSLYGVTSMNIAPLRSVRLGTPLKSVNGFATGSPAFWLMYLLRANPLTDLRGVPSRTLLRGGIFIDVTPYGDTLSLTLDFKSVRMKRARQMSSIVSLEVPFATRRARHIHV